MSHLYLAAPQKSSGKTTLSIGLCREWRRQGRVVQPFKKGPDYIDPMWLGRAAGRACLNLDFHTTPQQEIQDSFALAGQGADIGLIEGNVGLFDSVHLNGAQSNAELAKLLQAPVVLVVDCHGLGRGIAPLLLGYLGFDPDLNLAGVILNKVGGGRHAANLRQAVEYHTDLPVFGVVPRAAGVVIDERHLGLVPSNEAASVEATIERICAAVAAHVDVTGLAALADAAPPWSLVQEVTPWHDDDLGRSKLRIAIAQDDAFGFYYPDDLAALRRAGAELLPFSPVNDPAPPPADALLIGGGFPECRMQELEANVGMRAAIVDFIEAGGPAYAECGGLMYLTRRLHWQDRACRMCGVLDAEVAMHPTPQGRGYVQLRETDAFPWAPAGPAPFATNAGGLGDIAAHEFHYSALIQADPAWRYAYQVLRGTGIDGRHDGIVYRNLLAGYAHLRNVGGVRWTERFVNHVRALM